MKAKADVVICGAGIAGVAAAYHLAVTHAIENVILVDRRPPLSLTSEKSFEGYRAWWPGPDDAMIRLASDSIGQLEAMHRDDPAGLAMNRAGYVHATADPIQLSIMEKNGRKSSALGAGPFRKHTPEAGSYVPYTAYGVLDAPDGADLIVDQAIIREHFPYLTEKTIGVLHTRRCGWFDAQQFGMHMLKEALACGVTLVRGSVVDVQLANGKVSQVIVESSDGTQHIQTTCFVNAAGPFQQEVAGWLGIELPVTPELHIGMSLLDHRQAVPRSAPLVIWEDPINLPWSAEEREMLAESDETSWLLEELPAGIHCRPEGNGGGDALLMQWFYPTQPGKPLFPLPKDGNYPDMLIRGLSKVIPSLTPYLDNMPKPFFDGGYYVVTPENRPVVGPMGVEGAYILGGLGGSGMQLAPQCGTMLAAHITGSQLPEYASAFELTRYTDPAYQAKIAAWDQTGKI